jgi:hypothetical protein
MRGDDMPTDSRTARFVPGRTASVDRACGDARRRMWSCLHRIEMRLGTASLSIQMVLHTPHTLVDHSSTCGSSLRAEHCTARAPPQHQAWPRTRCSSDGGADCRGWLLGPWWAISRPKIPAGRVTCGQESVLVWMRVCTTGARFLAWFTHRSNWAALWAQLPFRMAESPESNATRTFESKEAVGAFIKTSFKTFLKSVLPSV